MSVMYVLLDQCSRYIGTANLGLCSSGSAVVQELDGPNFQFTEPEIPPGTSSKIWGFHGYTWKNVHSLCKKRRILIMRVCGLPGFNQFVQFKRCPAGYLAMNHNPRTAL